MLRIQQPAFLWWNTFSMAVHFFESARGLAVKSLSVPAMKPRIIS